jgi:hypothetical protein
MIKKQSNFWIKLEGLKEEWDIERKVFLFFTRKRESNNLILKRSIGYYLIKLRSRWIRRAKLKISVYYQTYWRNKNRLSLLWAITIYQLIT